MLRHRRLEGRAWRRLREVVMAAAGWRCAGCGLPAVDVDHIVPLSEGGSNALENLQALCEGCHVLKGRKG